MSFLFSQFLSGLTTAMFLFLIASGLSLAFGVLPLVQATGAGAASQRSIGITVASGMLASTCLAVLFVPSFFVLLQRFEEWRKPLPEAEPAPEVAAERT